MITSAVCDSYTQEILQGVHTSTDTYKIALYVEAADLSASTTSYTTLNESVGTGYVAGGKELTDFNTTIDTGVAILDFSDVGWATASITARGAMIYNSTKSNKAVAVLDFGANITSTNGTFAVQFPEPTATTGVIRIS